MTGHFKHSARELIAGSIGADPYETLERLTALGRDLAKLEGVVFELQNGMKPLLATIGSEYAVLHRKENLSESRLTRLSHADARYLERIRLVAEAITQRETARNNFWALKSTLDWDRASVAHLNALSKLDE